MVLKQKKLNKMTDMDRLVTRKSDEYFEYIHKQRLMGIELPDFVAEDFDLLESEHKKEKNIQPPITDYSGINLLPAKKPKFQIHLPEVSFANLPALAIFLGLCLLTASLFPLLQSAENKRITGSEVLGAAMSAYDDLLGAQTALINADYDEANVKLSRAYSGFNEANDALSDLGVVAGLIPQVGTGRQMLSAATEATLGVQYLVSGFTEILEIKIDDKGLSAGGGLTVSEKIARARTNIDFAFVYIGNAQDQFEKIDLSNIPPEFLEKIESAKKQLNSVLATSATIDSLQKLLAGFITEKEIKYLVLFQNHRELRAAGGFIGTVGLLTLRQGKILEFKIETVYNPDGQLKKQIAPPGPLQRILTDNWGLRDSNWFYDFPTSAKKAVEFYELETGISTDGVLAFTPEIFVNLLKLTGPIFIPGYEVVLNDKNFVDEVQRQTSEIYDRELNTPKKFLADFTPIFLNQLGIVALDNQVNFFEVVMQALPQKDIQLFSFDEEQQQTFELLGWAGAVRQEKDDYLAIINSNVGAGKTDQNISQDINLETKISQDGTVRNILTVTRTHAPGTETEFPVNIDFVRVYVPQGSGLVSATGFENYEFYPSSIEGVEVDSYLKKLDTETTVDLATNTLIYEEFGKTVFANWIEVAPGQSKQYRLEYILPISYNLSDENSKSYSLLIQKQAGAPMTSFVSEFSLPDGFEAEWVYPENIENHKNELKYYSIWEQDEVWGIVFR